MESNSISRREGQEEMMVKYRESNEEYFKKLYETPEGKAFLKTPQGKALLEKQEEVRAYQYQEPALEEILAIEEEQEAYQEKKYEKKKYFDERGVWIPRIVTFLILMLLFWLIGDNKSYYETALFCENRIC